MKKIFFLLAGFLSLLLSCQPSVQQPTVPLNTFKPSLPGPDHQTIYNILSKDCKAYWERVDSANTTKAAYFKEVILTKALKNKTLTETNKKFLLALGDILLVDDTVHIDVPGCEKILFPIFTMKEHEPAIFTFSSYYQLRNDIWEDNCSEHIWIEKTGFYQKHSEINEPPVHYFPEIFDSLYKDQVPELYIFTDKKRYTGKPAGLGTFYGECLEYFFYPLRSPAFQPGNKVLFGSMYPLDLIYENDSLVDASIRQQFKAACYDCQNSEHMQVSFARLKGADDLYFTYADTFPFNDQLFGPLRALIMRMENGYWTFLWLQEVDLFGCPCL